jgi:hypothetical protein
MVEVTLTLVLQFIQTAGILVGIVYYITTLRLAQKAREAQVFLQFSNRIADDRFLEGLRNLQEIDSSTLVDFILQEVTKDSPIRDQWINIWYIIRSLEDLGGIVRGGFLSISIIAYTISGIIKMTWEKLVPHIDEFREESNNIRWGSELEYLYEELMKYHEEHPELKT